VAHSVSADSRDVFPLLKGNRGSEGVDPEASLNTSPTEIKERY